MNVFVQIMNLIEKNTDIPGLMQDIAKWQGNSERNKKIFEIYSIASYARELED